MTNKHWKGSNLPWIVVLAGGSGRRLQTVTQALTGSPTPKQFCTFTLGDLYHDVGVWFPVSVEDAQRCFKRAVELDPEFPPYHVHTIDLAFSIDPDSVRAARLIEDYMRLSSADALLTRRLELGFDLALLHVAAAIAALRREGVLGEALGDAGRRTETEQLLRGSEIGIFENIFNLFKGFFGNTHLGCLEQFQIFHHICSRFRSQQAGQFISAIDFHPGIFSDIR